MLSHPYFRAIMALAGTAALTVCAILGWVVGAGFLALKSPLFLLAWLGAGVASILSAFLLIYAGTAVVFGAVRSMQRTEDRLNANRSRLAAQRAERARASEVPIPAAEAAAPAPAPSRPIRLVMRDSGGSIVNFNVRDPAKEAHYRARCERDGYAYIRTEQL